VKAVLAAGIVAFSLVLMACGDDDGSDADDPRRAEIGGVAGAAIGAYASVGPVALVDYMSQGALEVCSKDALRVALADQPVPTGFKQLEALDFSGDTASATITISTKDGEQDISWKYVEEDGNWRIADMPGMENCG